MAPKKDKKTLQEHQEDALYREVWEEVRVQRFYDFIKTNLRMILAVSILIIASVVVFQIVRHNNAEKLKSETLTYESAMAMAGDRQLEGAEVLLNKLANTSSDGMGDLAGFRAAQIDIQQNRKDDAIAKLEKLAKDGSSRDFKHLAIIKLAVLKDDTATAKDFERMMAPVLSKRSPFYFTGLYLVATKYVSEKNYPVARGFLNKIITDKNAPTVIAAQAEALNANIQQ
jgi:hypothetical protein